MTNQEIKDTGLLIKNEQHIGGNTAGRVGGVIEGIGYALDNKDAANGYYQATINGGSISVNAPNFVLGNGGNLRIKMPAAGTTASTLAIGNANAVQLWYNGAAVSSDNTWEAGEIISVFYDGTRFMASNSQGGSGKAEKIKYDKSQSGISSDNVQGAIDELADRTLIEGETISLGSAIAYVINSVGNWTGSSSTHYIINANAGDKFKVSANSSSNCTCIWLRQASTPSQGGNAYVSNVDNKRYVVEAGGEIIVTAPSDAVQLYIQGAHSGTDHTPSNVYSMYSIKDISLDNHDKINGAGINVFSDTTIRRGMCINSVSPYDIVTYTSQQYILTNFIKIPDGTTYITYKGIVGISALLCRFSQYAQDNGNSVAVSLKIDGSLGVIPSSMFGGYKYVTFGVARQANGTAIDLSGVEIKFNNVNDLIFGESTYSTPTKTSNVILSSSYPAVSNSAAYYLSGYIAVNKGDIVFVPQVKAWSTSVVISGYSSQSQTDNIEELKIIGTSSGENDDYACVVPAGVNYIRIGAHKTSINSALIYYIINPSNSGLYAELVRVVDSDRLCKQNLLEINASNPFDTLYPSIRPRKGCVLFQMDCNQYFFANSAAYTAKLREYGVNYCTLLCLNNTFSSYINTIKDLKAEGNEIGIHGVGTHTNYEATLLSYMSDFANNGLDWDGFVELSTAITAQELIVAKKYFSWIIKNGGDYDCLSNDYMQSLMTINDSPSELKRLGIEIRHSDANVTTFANAVANVKSAIDDAVNNQKLLVIYGHTYAQTSNTNYTVYNEVLEPVLAYLKNYIIEKRVIVGRTTPILNFYFSKRYNE